MSCLAVSLRRGTLRNGEDVAGQAGDVSGLIWTSPDWALLSGRGLECLEIPLGGDSASRKAALWLCEMGNKGKHARRRAEAAERKE